MRTLLLALLVVGSMAQAKSKIAEPLSQYLISVDEMLKLSEAEQVSYFKAMLQMVAEVEYQSNGVYGFEDEKTAQWQNLFNRFIEQVDAADNPYKQKKDSSMIGLYCIYGAHASVYYKTSSGAIQCQPVSVGKNAPATCQTVKGQTGAGCGEFLGHTIDGGYKDVCVKHKPPTNNGVENGLTYRCVRELARRMTGTDDINALDGWIKGYLKRVAGDAKLKKQMEEWLEKMKKAFDDFEKTAFKDKNGNPIGFNEYCTPDGRNEKNYGRQDEECEALRRYRAAIFQSGLCPKGGSTGKCPPTETGQPEKQAENCVDAKKTQLGDLSCVACGVKEARGQDASNWISLLGSTAQIFNQDDDSDPGVYNVKDATSRKRFQSRVIQMLSSYSYCTNNNYDRAEINSKAGEVRNWIDGQSFPLSGWLENYKPHERTFMKTYGVSDASGYGMNVIDELFEDDDFDKNNVVYRQVRFRMANANMDNITKKHSKEFLSCRRDVGARMQNDPAFNMCSRESDKTATKEQADANRTFCETVAKACGITDTKAMCKPEPLKCPKKTAIKQGGNGNAKGTVNPPDKPNPPGNPPSGNGESGGEGGGAATF